MKYFLTSLYLSFIIVHNLNAQVHFSLSDYLNKNQVARNTISYKDPKDSLIVEALVNQLLTGEKMNYPDIYETRLDDSDTMWAYYPDSITWQIYYRYLAFSIYTDYGNLIPWKIKDLPDDQIGF